MSPLRKPRFFQPKMAKFGVLPVDAEGLNNYDGCQTQ